MICYAFSHSLISETIVRKSVLCLCKTVFSLINHYGLDKLQAKIVKPQGNLRSVVRNVRSVLLNGRSELANVHSVVRNGDFPGEAN